MSEEREKVDNGFVEFEREPKVSATVSAAGDYAEKVQCEKSQEEVSAPHTIKEEQRIETQPALSQESKTLKGAQNEKGVKHSKPLVLMGVVGVLVVLGILAGAWSQQVSLHEFVVTGNRLARTEAITERINFLLGKAMREVHLAQIEDTLCTLPLIKKVVATKEFPSTIHLRIEERQFVAFTAVGERLKVVGEDGVLADAEPEFLGKMRLPWLSGFEKVHRTRQGLLVLDSAEAKSALELLAALQQRELCRTLIAEVRLTPKELLVFSNEADTRFVFGCDGEYERMLRYFEAFWKQVIVKKGVQQFEYVDLRYNRCVFAKSVQNLKLNFENQRQ
ncbi:MAG: cell division protein FtsQ/DivIB [Candidatus Thermochlorobacter sp.]